MDQLVMAAQLILALTILVAIHEFGHFITAKLFGMRVPKFFIFFDAWGKKLWSKKVGDTEYGIGWLPLGGYVQISGMIDETQSAKDLQKEPEPWEFRAKPIWQRFIVMIAGIVMNLILGFMLFVFITKHYRAEYIPMTEINKEGIYALPAAEEIGFKNGDKIISINGSTPERFNDAKTFRVMLNGSFEVERNGQKQIIQTPPDFANKLKAGFIAPLPQKTVISQIAPDLGADKAGLKQGDEITKLQGHAVGRFLPFRDSLAQYKNSSVQLEILREGKPLSITAQVDTAGKLGFIPDYEAGYSKKPYTIGSAFGYGISDGWDLLIGQALSIGKMFKGDINVRENLASPIGIAQIYGSEWDWSRFWSITAMLSLVLAFMNLLPIPALDGGHIVFLGIEAVMGRKVPEHILEKAQIVGFVLVMALMVFAFGRPDTQIIQ